MTGSTEKDMENEVKFKIKNTKKLRFLLTGAGAHRCSRSREIDYFFDRRDGSISRGGLLLRLRKRGKRAILTFKGPVLPSRFKKREEINLEMDGFDKIDYLLNNIGFERRFGKEKVRETFKYEGLIISIDKLPFLGFYLELEGKDREILSFIKRFGFNLKDAIRESYTELFSLYCIVNQERIKRFGRKIEFSFGCEKAFKRCGDIS